MSQAKVITDEKTTREHLLAGVTKLADVVGSTLGPMANNVVIETPYGATTVTKDGVTVAKAIDLEHPVENLGAQILKQAASRTASLAGDGTTTATVIAASLVKGAHRLIAAGVKPIEIKRRFEALLNKTLSALLAKSKPVSQEKIKEIATISANNDEAIGTLIASAYEHVGPEGLITLEESKTGATLLETVHGVAFDKGYASPYFITDSAKAEAVLENPLIFITDSKLRYTQELAPIMEKAHALNKPLLIICDEIEGQALQIAVINKMRGILQIAAVTAPSFGQTRAEILKDIAAITSAKVISEDAAVRLEDTKTTDFGTAAKVVISKNRTVFIDPKRNEELIDARAEEIRSQLTGENDMYIQQKMQRRLADLKAKIAVLHVGAATETELKETKDRVDDALRATACAMSKGYLIGGGTALARVGAELDIENELIDPVFVQALQSPLMKIASNAGKSPEVILHNVITNPDPSFGYNALTNEYAKLEEEGVIDPLLVVEQAVTNATSAANMIMLSAHSVTSVDRKEPYSPGNLDDYTS